MKFFTLLFSFLFLSLLSPGSALAMDGDREWQFRVLLDGSPIGTHQFEVMETGDTRRVKSEASFNVKFLFFNAYRYNHSNTEQWSNGCLREIDSETVTNGKQQDVDGEQQGDNFVVHGSEQETLQAECVMTFAYWNPEFLAQERLLNPQTGEYLDVEVEKLGTETIEVRGESSPATRFRIKAKDTDVEVWYSPDNKWLALQSVAKGGRIIRYELI